MEINTIVGLIGTLGFPIVACLIMGWFIYQIYKKTTKQNEENMAAVQARCKEREEKLYKYLEETKTVNAQALATIALYAERLGTIEQDVREIKTDITHITEHLE